MVFYSPSFSFKYMVFPFYFRNSVYFFFFCISLKEVKATNHFDSRPHTTLWLAYTTSSIHTYSEPKSKQTNKLFNYHSTILYGFQKLLLLLIYFLASQLCFHILVLASFVLDFFKKIASTPFLFYLNVFSTFFFTSFFDFWFCRLTSHYMFSTLQSSNLPTTDTNGQLKRSTNLKRSTAMSWCE